MASAGRARRPWLGAGTWRRRAAIASLGLCALVAPAATPPSPGPQLPSDLVIADDDTSPAAVVFRHTSHVALADWRCSACHPAPFSILGDHRRITHERMEAGEACAVCHNGTDASAFDDADSCDACHCGTAAVARRPPEVRIPRGAASPGPVVFRHSTHTQPCSVCHPEPFLMQAGRSPIVKEAMFEGQTCGRCHDGGAAFGVDDGDACDACHAAEGDGR